MRALFIPEVIVIRVPLRYSYTLSVSSDAHKVLRRKHSYQAALPAERNSAARDFDLRGTICEEQARSHTARESLRLLLRTNRSVHIRQRHILCPSHVV